MTTSKFTRSKLHKIIKNYNIKLDQYNKEWEELCHSKKRQYTADGMYVVNLPSIYDHESYSSKGAKLFRELMKELNDAGEVFF